MKTTDAANLMGTRVVVTHELERNLFVEDGKQIKRWVSYPRTPRTGWFTGIRWLQEGYVEGGHYFGEYDYDPAFLKETGNRTACALVVFWPNENPKRVPLDGFRVWADGDPEPFSTSGFGEHHRDRYRSELSELMREESRNQPRDKKGRFVK